MAIAVGKTQNGIRALNEGDKVMTCCRQDAPVEHCVVFGVVLAEGEEVKILHRTHVASQQQQEWHCRLSVLRLNPIRAKMCLTAGVLLLYLPFLFRRRHALQVPPRAAHILGFMVVRQAGGARQSPPQAMPPRLCTTYSARSQLATVLSRQRQEQRHSKPLKRCMSDAACQPCKSASERRVSASRAMGDSRCGSLCRSPVRRR